MTKKLRVKIWIKYEQSYLQFQDAIKMSLTFDY